MRASLGQQRREGISFSEALMIYILGVNEHRYQAVNPKTNPDEAKFYDYVLKHVRAKMISHLAEEMNDEFLQRENQAQESVCRKLANDLGITHSMCEPNTLERRQIGYIDKSSEEIIGKTIQGVTKKSIRHFPAFTKTMAPSRRILVSKITAALKQKCSFNLWGPACRSLFKAASR